ncbi:unnamed protein product [Phytophthora fragariaefolia]|uniref:Unnamed protein product n=1 Tax=Phytophthora fragariaefolia TaxID=1490495 RepID=A0A9W6TYD9_9STRA|nr:unnamed protein product [Phytophthora fragariaefolia]
MGFTYAPVIHESQLYNPLFHSYLGSDGSLTYAYAQTLFLSRNDNTLSYNSGITLGVATEGLALVPWSGGNISGIGALSCSSLTVNRSSVVAPPSYVIGITEGSAAASKALVLDSMLDVSGINSLGATNLAGTLQTASQPSITSLGTLSSITISGALTMSGISISSSEISVLDAFSKALVLNSSRNISGIGCLSATSLTGTLQTAAQPNIKSVGTLTSLTISGGISASGTINLGGIVNCNNSTYASSPLSGSLVISGGIGIQKNIAIGGIASSSSQWTLIGIQYQSRATTYTDTSSVAGATVISSYGQPTIVSTNSITITRAATVYIDNAQAQGTNTTIANSYSLLIASEKVLLGDSTSSSSTTTRALVITGGVGIGGQLTVSTIAGTLQTTAQPNITSIGTLANLSVSGGLTASTLTGTLRTASQLKITLIGTLTSLDVSGFIAGTLSTAAQPNITSLGNLTNLNVLSGATTGEIANISMPAQPAGYSSWITTGKSSSGNEGGRIGYYHDSTYANQYLYIPHSNKSPFFVLANNSCVGINTLTPTHDLDLVGQARITGTLLFAGASRTISNVLAYSGGTITTSGDIMCGGYLKGYLGYGNQSTISTVGVLTEVAIGSTGVYNSQEYLLINGNGSNYLVGAYTRMCSFYGSNVTPAWFQIEVSNGSKTVSTSTAWIGNNSDSDLRFGTNNNTYGICLGGTNRGRWGFGTTSPAYDVHNALAVSTTIDPASSGVAYFLKSGGLVNTLGPHSAIPIGIGTLEALLASSGVYTTSDARIKKDWTELSDDVWDSMLKVEPLLFRSKTDDDSVPLQLGYKAQDLLRANISHCINFTPNADMHVEDPEVDTEGIQYSVDYSKMVCLLHLLVLRQQKEINELKSLISGR